MYVITVHFEGGTWQRISSCEVHIPGTHRRLGEKIATIEDVSDQIGLFTCKGCLEGWERAGEKKLT